VAPAQTAQEILGPWDMTINAMGQNMNVTMTVGMQGDALTVTMQSPQGDQQGEDVKYENQILSWKTQFGPAKLDLAVKVDGATFAGEPETPFGKIDIKGRKLTEAELAERGSRFEFLVGDWDTTSEYDGQMLSSKMRIVLRDGRPFGADMGSNDGPDADGYTPLRVDGDSIMWRVPLPYVSERGGTVRVTVDRENMTFAGTMRSSLGEVPITGKYVDTTKLVQAAYDDPTPVIGDWDLEYDLAGTAGAAKMTIADRDGRLHAVITSDAGDFASDSVEYTKIGENMGSLRVHVDIPELSADTLTFEFIVDGEDFMGEEIHSDGAYFISGTKVSDTPSGGQPQAAAAPAGITAAQVMAMLDTNKDGKITEDEAPEQLKQFFSVVDADGNGYIDEAEAQMIADFMSNQN
jgi:hypothetical protein